ncbi:amidase family protein [Kribbella sindirgiensis]|uniref:Amidase n=1 Tax=Kribbella sindirgiensis TaxID=1124744 RepID=A0A4R0IL26_9ACTN|nr:amidase family protein [Kribbella sindirgiensis]TCC33477.1 amidase [Kribbella sindirgiensis]
METAGEVAERIRTGQVTSREVTEALLARIADDTQVNAVVEVRAEHALAAADRADAQLAELGGVIGRGVIGRGVIGRGVIGRGVIGRGVIGRGVIGRGVVGRGVVGPLHGVPVTVKDCFNVAGMRTTWGNPAFAEYVADRDAVVVERLQRAGAIVVGKTNVHTMLADFGQTANEVYGRTNNPADLDRTPGGSSGGAAAALAADLTYLEYGSDLVGSIRLPAAYCGVYGLKPTNGLVPLRGFEIPGTPYLPTELPNLSTIGPLARSAADLRTALRATAGPEAPYSYNLCPPRHDRLQDYRVGVVTDHPAAPVSSEVGDALSDTIDRLARSGAKIVNNWPDGVDANEQAADFGRQVELFFALHGDSDSAPDSDGGLTAADVRDLDRRRLQARASWQQYFKDIDVFLCPTSFTVAFPHGSTTIDGKPYETQVFWIAPAALTGHPALSMPIERTPGGLPVGAQVIGPWHEDDTAITFAELLAG